MTNKRTIDNSANLKLRVMYGFSLVLGIGFYAAMLKYMFTSLTPEEQYQSITQLPLQKSATILTLNVLYLGFFGVGISGLAVEALSKFEPDASYIMNKSV